MQLSRFFRGAAPFTVAVLALAANGVARADTALFSFTSTGFGVMGTCAGGGDCVEAFSVGDADDTAGNLFPIATSWSQFLNFTLTPSTGVFTGTWSLTDIGSDFNDLSGTFTGQWVQLSSTQSLATLSYTVTAGSGLFAGATGGGQSLLTADADFNYSETGILSVGISAVPEPATYGLMLAGLVGMAGFASRQRRG